MATHGVDLERTSLASVTVALSCLFPMSILPQGFC